METGIVGSALLRMRTFKLIRPFGTEPDPDRFGACYECKDGYHSRCVGGPCECMCPTTLPGLLCNVCGEPATRIIGRRKDGERQGKEIWTDIGTCDMCQAAVSSGRYPEERVPNKLHTRLA